MTGQADDAWTVLRLVNWTKEYFARCGLESPRLAAEMLLAHVLDCRRIELYARYDHQPPADQLAAFRRLVGRAGKHEPVAYLVGGKDFYSIRFSVTPDVLIPRPETEGLVTEAVGHLRRLGRPGTLWDVCTGSGCVAVAVAAQVADARALATDVSPAAVAVAAANARANGLGDRVTCRAADLLMLPDEVAGMAPFDVVTANPPYVADGDDVAESVKHEPRDALYAGADGLNVIRRLIPAAGAPLAGGGLLVMEFGRGQAEAVGNLIVSTGSFGEPRILRDHNDIERIVAALKRG